MATLFKFMSACIINNDQSAANVIPLYSNLDTFLIKTMLKSENIYLKNEMSRKLKDILGVRSNNEDISHFYPILEALLFKVQPLAEQFDFRCFPYYEGVSSLLEVLSQQDLLPLQNNI